jgi:hypothetical protein
VDERGTGVAGRAKAMAASPSHDKQRARTVKNLGFRSDLVRVGLIDFEGCLGEGQGMKNRCSLGAAQGKRHEEPPVHGSFSRKCLLPWVVVSAGSPA